MSKNKLYFLGKGVLKVGRDLVKSGDEVDQSLIEDKALKRLIKDGKIGEKSVVVKKEDKNIVQDLRNEISDLKKQLSESFSEDIEKELSKKDKQIENLQKKNEGLEKQIENLKKKDDK